jgi:3-isopropylmalate/(R)-2-methylmalate dehydratase small subunit
VLKRNEIAQLFKEVEAQPGYQVTVDLAAQTVTTPSGTTFHFDVDPFRKDCLLKGLDEIGLTLEHEKDITAYEQRRKQEVPWLFPDLP